MDGSWSNEEEMLVAEFRKVMKPDIPEHLYENKILFYKFLKARNFNLNQAESMLRKHLIWRKEIQIDTIIKDFKPSEVLKKYVSQNFIGYDKHGDVISYSALGNTDGKGLFKSANKIDVLRCVLQHMELDARRLKLQSERLGRPLTQCLYIYDMENITLAKATHRSSLELFKQGISIFQDNYPEFLKSIYIINSSMYFTMAFSIIKVILSGALIDKIKVYGKDGWKEELLTLVDSDVLPAFLGGNRTDPDGNPNCNTFIGHAGMIPEKYYLTKDIKKIASKEGIQNVIIDRHSRVAIPVVLPKRDMILHWEYELKNHDIGFGLSMESVDTNFEEVALIPVGRRETENESETGTYRCKHAGTYYIIFDNSYSWFHSKEVYYRTWISERSDKDSCKRNYIFELDSKEEFLRCS